MSETGILVNPIPGITIKDLSPYVSPQLRKRAAPKVEAFLAACVLAAEDFACTDSKITDTPASVVLDQLTALERAAHVVVNALDAATADPATLAVLDAEIAIRSTLGPTPSFSTLHQDASTLRQLAKSAAARIKPDRHAPTKEREKRLVRWLAEAYRDAFGALPPQRSWFGNEFAAYIAERLGLRLSARIVSATVREMTSTG